ncbi:hypothetical protein WOLCODRAFT_140567 [Wolfiporia cocos MD-104 SS10]|uniref:Nucleoporin Nup54 alpha-helical domain-containing protein n=1 Tax=Wolfiporia cocos (strain MD-104) TaxID=742152 RepID=A0A2H3J508_WOLCO|nr:hypothetical protein WOLCODRAFT_140567 [Wolfiporia cocos MD-104 SS10]
MSLFGNASGSGTFGSTAQQPAQQSGSLFGNAGNTQGTATGGLFGQTNNQSGGGLFGNAATQQQGGTNQLPPGSLFGTPSTINASTANNAPGGGLFGNAGGAANPNTGTSGGNIFGNFGGNTNANASTGGGLFGNMGGNANANATGGGGLFVNAAGSGGTANQSGGGLFGNAGGATNTNANTGGGGLFGSTNANTNTGGSGLFGSTNANAGGGLFGSTNANTNVGTNAPGGGLSGGSMGSNAGNAPGGGLFGNLSGSTNASSNNMAGGGLFGNFSGASNTNTSGGGLFGSNNQNPNQNQNQQGTLGGGGLFGSTSGGGLFGNASTAPSTSTGTGSLFGSQFTQAGAGAGSLFGSSASTQRPGGMFGTGLGGSTLLSSTGGNLFASRPALAPGHQQADAYTQFLHLKERIEGIAQAWDPDSPQCRFQHFFYNLVDPSQVHLYGRPPKATSDAAWQKAVRENPDPTCLVPVLAVGFDDLQQRVEAQSKQAAAHQEKMKELQTRIANLAQRHQLSNATRFQRATTLQTQLTHRVLRLVQHLHLLIPALRSSAIRPEEEALRAALEDIEQEIRRPGGTGRMRGKLNELWALVGAVTAARERDRRGGSVEWAVVDDEGLSRLTQILAMEQAGLAHLTRILQQDLKDLAVIQGTNTKEEDADVLLKSTSTLRGSAVY